MDITVYSISSNLHASYMLLWNILSKNTTKKCNVQVSTSGQSLLSMVFIVHDSSNHGFVKQHHFPNNTVQTSVPLHINWEKLHKVPLAFLLGCYFLSTEITMSIRVEHTTNGFTSFKVCLMMSHCTFVTQFTYIAKHVLVLPACLTVGSKGTKYSIKILRKEN